MQSQRLKRTCGSNYNTYRSYCTVSFSIVRLATQDLGQRSQRRQVPYVCGVVNITCHTWEGEGKRPPEVSRHSITGGGPDSRWSQVSPHSRAAPCDNRRASRIRTRVFKCDRYIIGMKTSQSLHPCCCKSHVHEEHPQSCNRTLYLEFDGCIFISPLFIYLSCPHEMCDDLYQLPGRRRFQIILRYLPRAIITLPCLRTAVHLFLCLTHTAHLHPLSLEYYTNPLAR